MSKESKKETVGLEELKSLISEVMKEQDLDAKISEAVAPLNERVTHWGDILMQTQSKTTRQASQDEQAIGVARIVRALAAAKGDPSRAANFGKKAWNDDLGDVCVKALTAGDFTAGGFLVPDDLSQDMIPLLRAANVVRAMGTPTVPMPHGTLTLPKQTADISAAYVGESTDITKTEPTGGHITLTAKKLAALVPISNDLLDYDVGDAADRWVRDNLVRHIAGVEDQKFIRGDGLSGAPKGLRYWAQTANVTASNGTSAANIESDFKDLLQDLEGNNVDMSNPVWIMAPRSKNHLLTLRDANGNLIYPDMRAAMPTIHTYPVFITNNIPTNLSTNQTELYLVNVPDCLIGEAGGMEISVDSSASYVQSGSLVSAFSRDETVVRAILKHDLAVTHAESVAVKNAITWGS
ncbi:phage major capsid protein [bacterium]|nr:phage major capsid protein [bacterium]